MSKKDERLRKTDWFFLVVWVFFLLVLVLGATGVFDVIVRTYGRTRFGIAG